MSILLGIDVGITNTGVSIYNTDTCSFLYQNTIVATHERIEEKLVFLEKCLETLIKDYKVTQCCYEHPVMTKGRNVQNINCALGVIYLVLCRNNIPFKGLTPFYVKRALTGNSKADKKEVTKAVLKRNSTVTKFDSHHAADAAACVFAFLDKKDSE